MTETKERFLKYFCPDYEEISYTLEDYTDAELQLVSDNMPDSIDDLSFAIEKAVEWEIIGDILNMCFVEDNFYDYHEDMIMDFCNQGDSIVSSVQFNTYGINKKDCMLFAQSCIDNLEEEELDKWHLVEDFDINSLLVNLNRFTSFKFVEWS